MTDSNEPNSEWAPNAEIPGYGTYQTTRGDKVITIDYFADPAKRDPAWILGEEKRYTSRSKFEREMLRNWHVGQGTIFFPEFMASGGRDKFVVPINHLIDGPIYRGWDFGRRAPAVVWFQYDTVRRRVLVHRSLTPTYVGVHAFRDTVLFLSGQIPYEALTYDASRSMIAELEAGYGPRPPWFVSPPNKPLQFVDYGGWEATHESDMVSEESQAKTRAEVLGERGIYLSQIAAASDRDTLMRKLLELRPDGWPGILFDPQNELLIDAIAGGLTYKEPTPLDPEPTVYKKTGTFDNVYEALTYGVVGVVPLNFYEAETPQKVYDGRRLMPQGTVNTAGLFHEGRRRLR